MKKALLFLFILSIGRAAPAQILVAFLFGDKLNSGKLEFGITVSPSLSDITGIDSKAKAGLNLGLYFNIKINEHLFIHPEGIAKASFGAWKIPPYPTGNDTLNNLFASGDVKRKISALSLPILLRFQVKGLLFAEAGPQVDLQIKAKDIYTATVNDNDLSYTTNIRDEITWFDLGLAGGLVYKLKKDKGMGVGIRYYYGLTDIQKNISGNQRNSVWQLNVTIPIGSAKTTTPPKSQ